MAVLDALNARQVAARKREARKRGVIYCSGCGRQRVVKGGPPPETLRGTVDGLTYLCRDCGAAQRAPDAASAKRRFETEADGAIWPVLDRASMTMREACQVAEVAEATVRQWRSGRTVAFRDTLQRFADALEAPDLLEVVPWRWRRITLKCRWCDHETSYTAGDYQTRRRAGGLIHATVDWTTGQGAHTCQPCHAKEQAYRMGRKYRDRLKKKGGRKALNNWLATLRERRGKKLATGGRQPGPQENWANAVSHTPPGQLSIGVSA